MGIVLGLITISGPLGFTMYVPAFAEIARDLGSPTEALPLTLVSYFIALAVGQNIYGPLSDRYGRKQSLYIGLGLYVAASIGGSFSGSVDELVWWRFVQGLGACAAIAMPRAIVRDLHTGPQAARLLGIVLLLSSSAPLVAPLLGSALTSLYSWRMIFWLLAAVGLGGLLLVHFLLPETRPAAMRRSVPLGAIARGYWTLLRERQFISLALVAGLGQAAFHSFVAGSPLIYISLFELEPWQYSIIFGCIAGLWGVSAQFTSPLMQRLGAERLVKITAAAGAAISLVLVLVASVGTPDPLVLSLLFALLFVTSGLMMPTATVLALHPHESTAGTASAVVGTAGFATGAVGSALVSILADGTAIPTVAVMGGCAFGFLIATWSAFTVASEETID